MRALLIAGANVRRTAGDRRMLMVAAGFPVLVMILVGSLFNAGRGRLAVGISAAGSGGLGTTLVTALGRSPLLHVRRERSLAAATSDLRRGVVLLAVSVPAGYDTTLRSGGRERVVVVGQAGSPGSAEARVAVTQLVAQQSAAVASGTPDAPIFIPAKGRVELVKQGGRLDLQSPSLSPYSYTSPANLVLFAFILCFVIAVRGVSDRQAGVVRRILGTPTRPSSVIAAELLTAFVIAVGQAAGLVVVGTVVFAVHWGDPIALTLLVVVVAATAAGAGVTLGTMVASPEQVIAIGVPLGLVLGMLGGCMWPLAIVGPLMRTVGHVAPTAWAMDGFVSLIYAGGGVRDIAPDLAVLAGFAACLTVVATARLRWAI